MNHVEDLSTAIKAISQHVTKESGTVDKSAANMYKHKLTENKKVAKMVNA